jgi:hypothetical protein
LVVRAQEKDVVKHIDHIFDEAWGYLDTEDILKFPFFQGLDKKKKGKKGRGKDAARAARAACTYRDSPITIASSPLTRLSSSRGRA